MRSAGHVFRIWNNATLGLPERKLVRRVMRVLEDLVQQELYARQALVEDSPRVFKDSVMRALAILRAACLLSPWELFDLLSPIRLAANMGYLVGISRDEVVSLMENMPEGQWADSDWRRKPVSPSQGAEEPSNPGCGAVL